MSLTPEQTSERQLATLLKAAKAVHEAFTGGYNPTEQQLDRLAGAIAFCEAQKVCGHPIAEDCYCFGEVAHD